MPFRAPWHVRRLEKNTHAFESRKRMFTAQDALQRVGQRWQLRVVAERFEIHAFSKGRQRLKALRLRTTLVAGNFAASLGRAPQIGDQRRRQDASKNGVA